jgi:hypothetical protein
VGIVVDSVPSCTPGKIRTCDLCVRKTADINIRDVADDTRIYQPSAHLEAAGSGLGWIGEDSTMDKATGIWSIDKPAGIVSLRLDFRFEQLNQETGTVYVMVPEEKLAIYRGFLRAIIGRAIFAMTRQKQHLPKIKRCSCSTRPPPLAGFSRSRMG